MPNSPIPGIVATTTETNLLAYAEQPDLPLLRLPGELRNRIYGFVFISPSPIPLYKVARSPTVTRVCRQLRIECIPMFYGDHVFDSHFDSSQYPRGFFLHKLSKEKRAMLRKVLLFPRGDQPTPSTTAAWALKRADDTYAYVAEMDWRGPLGRRARAPQGPARTAATWHQDTMLMEGLFHVPFWLDEEVVWTNKPMEVAARQP